MPLEKGKNQDYCLCQKILLKRLQKSKGADVPKSGERERERKGRKRRASSLLLHGKQVSENRVAEQDGRGGLASWGG